MAGYTLGADYAIQWGFTNALLGTLSDLLIVLTALPVAVHIARNDIDSDLPYVRTLTGDLAGLRIGVKRGAGTPTLAGRGAARCVRLGRLGAALRRRFAPGLHGGRPRQAGCGQVHDHVRRGVCVPPVEPGAGVGALRAGDATGDHAGGAGERRGPGLGAARPAANDGRPARGHAGAGRADRAHDPDRGAADRRAGLIVAHRLDRPWNATWSPALSVPMGPSTMGLPLGLQIAGKPLDDVTVLRVGDAFQQHTDWHLQVPPAMEEVVAV